MPSANDYRARRSDKVDRAIAAGEESSIGLDAKVDM